ncbi:MAG: TfoX/Sxy family protein [Gammaproteobacteria bacterium]
MGSKQDTVNYLADQMAGAGEVTVKKMFGEYGIFCDGKMAAVVCDDQLYVKKTEPGAAYIGTPVEQSPYPGAKPWYLIDGERWEDREWLAELLRITALAMPMPKPKAKKK